MKQETSAVLDEIASRQRSDSLTSEHFPFFMTMLGMKKLSYEDIYVMALSMFSDGLTSVSA